MKTYDEHSAFMCNERIIFPVGLAQINCSFGNHNRIGQLSGQQLHFRIKVNIRQNYKNE